MKVGIFGLVFIVFLVLKLTGYIAWSWVWVTSPLWIGLLLFLLLFVAIVILND
jgi:energy-coupling factor transporter transmembrane protein EcfT